MSEAAARALGLFGKIPSHGDYVRLNAAEPAALALFDWVQAALDGVLRGGERLPVTAVHFALPFPDAGATVVGTMGPSRDSVGRVFPLVVFDTIELPTAAGGLAGVLFGATRLRSEIAALLADSVALTPAALLGRVRALRPVSQPELEQGRAELLAGLSSTPASAICDPAFAGLRDGEAASVLAQLTGCCRPYRRREPSRPGPLLDVPVAHDSSQLFWMDAVTRLLDWRASHCAALWTGGALPRMVLALGSSPSAVLALVNASKGGSRLVSLRSAAVTGAPPAAAALLSAPQATLSDVIGALVSEVNA